MKSLGKEEIKKIKIVKALNRMNREYKWDKKKGKFAWQDNETELANICKREGITVEFFHKYKKLV